MNDGKIKRLWKGIVLCAVCFSLFLPFAGGVTGKAAPVQTVTIVKNAADLDEYYEPQHREWQAIATVEATGERIWAAWMAGGVTEPDPANYIVVGYSDDKGETWTDPFLIIDDDFSAATRMRDPVLWLDDAGILWLFYGFDGTYAITVSHPEAPPGEIKVSEPRYLFGETILNKPIATSWGEWICSVDPFIQSDLYRTGYFRFSDDQGKTWGLKGTASSLSDNKKWHEGTLVEKRDGTLWCLSRIESGAAGGIEQTFSRDRGKTWSTYAANLPAPLNGPGSKCALARLSSGNLLFVSNDSTSARINMTAYLSEDDGATWKSLLLDSRMGCAYPDVAEDGAGNIYVVWDYGRTEQNEIRLARFTEEDVINSAFYTANAKNMIAVSKDAAYSDLVKVKTSFKNTLAYTVEDDVTQESIVSMLPKEIVVVTDKGEEYTLTGEWKTNWFSAEYAGVYTFRFEYAAGVLPPKTADNLALLTVKVVVKEKAQTEEKGCFSTLRLAPAALSMLTLTGFAIYAAKRKRIFKI